MSEHNADRSSEPADAGWTIHGASVLGRGHERFGYPCQDAHAWTATDSALCLVVADGAGSAPRSEEGSRAAVAAVVDHVRDVAAPTVDGCVHAAADALRCLAGEASIDELATTLLVVVVDATGLHVVSVGDGAVVIQGPDGDWQVVTPPEQPGGPAFLTDDSWEQHVETFHDAGGVRAVIAATDGLRAELADAAGLATMCERICAWTTSPYPFADWLAGFEERSGDDKTVVIAQAS
jgi:hypothetical protein